jgi:hypothetical protein
VRLKRFALVSVAVKEEEMEAVLQRVNSTSRIHDLTNRIRGHCGKRSSGQ